MKSRRKSEAAAARSADRAAERSADEADVPVLNRRGTVLGAGVIAFAALVVMHCGVMSIDVARGFFTDGLLVAGQVVSGAMLGAWVLRISKPASRMLAFVTTAAVGLGVISLVVLGLGLTGWLNRWTGVSVLLVGPVAYAPILLRRWDGKAIAAWFAEPAGWEWLWLAAMPMLAIAASGASVAPGLLWKPLDPHPFDVTAYHLQVPREWYEAGKITPLLHNVYSFFPFLVEMHFLLQMHLLAGPWAAMYAAQLFCTAVAALFVMAVYGAVEEVLLLRGAARPRAGAIVGAVMVAGVPWVAMVGAVAYVEGGLLLYSALALAWVMRALLRGGSMSDMAVGGVVAGLACGVKYTAVPAVVGVYGIAFLVGLLAHRNGATDAPQPALSRRRHVGAIALFAGVAALVFAPWAVRNWAWSGNPVFPLALNLLGTGHFDALQVERFERAHRASEADAPLARRMSLVVERIVADRQYGYVLIPAGLVALALLAREREGWVLMIVLAGQLLFFMAFTHLMPRFALGVVPVCAVAVGICVGLRPVRAPFGAAAALACVIAGFAVLHPMFAQRVQGPAQVLFRLKDLSPLNPPELTAATESDAPIALIGHSQPFMITAPMRRVKYRMVFDVPSAAGSDALDAWLGVSEETLRRSGHLIVVDPLELRRYADTYWKVPALGDRIIEPGYVLPADGPAPPPGYAVQQADGSWRVGPWPWKNAAGLHHLWRPQPAP